MRGPKGVMLGYLNSPKRGYIGVTRNGGICYTSLVVFAVDAVSVLELGFWGCCSNLFQWLFLVPPKGGIGGIVHPPIGRKNATYIPLIYCLLGGLYATYHLLGEPETTIDCWCLRISTVDNGIYTVFGAVLITVVFSDTWQFASVFSDADVMFSNQRVGFCTVNLHQCN